MRGFVNRQAQLAALDALAREADDPSEPVRPVTVSIIAGAPGVGKTALAVYWAHRERARYRDGDLYVDLRGYGPGPRVEAAQALETLLRGLGVAPDRIPADLDGRAAMYRSLLDGRRMLVLIDNAASADQVRPLLPASPHCLVIVTSRNSLPGLTAREGRGGWCWTRSPRRSRWCCCGGSWVTNGSTPSVRRRGGWCGTACSCRWPCGSSPNASPPARVRRSPSSSPNWTMRGNAWTHYAPRTTN
ncbi:ATP-binding protein [Thermobifida fusca]|uniref:ATP-binding protein n=1 Tax=Thermobifida fusca TaxID=2021 RepID=UPI001D0CDB53|nr:ATP-binding protein [Thermobifida fusca]